MITRRSFLGGAAAMMAAGLVPAIPGFAASFPGNLPLVFARPATEIEPIGIGEFRVMVRFWRDERKGSFAEKVWYTGADHGHVFEMNGANLLKVEYPKMWEWWGHRRYNHPDGIRHYETSPFTFRLSNMMKAERVIGLPNLRLT